MEIHVEEVVLHGLGRIDAAAFEEALGAELQRRVGQGAIAGPGREPVDAGTVAFRGGSERALAAGVAARVAAAVEGAQK